MGAYTPPDTVLAAGIGTIGALFHARAAADPDRIAVRDGARALTYADLEDRTNRLANHLLSSGFSPGDRVALLATNCQEYVEVELAAAKAGVIVACLNWRLGARELRHCITLVEPNALIVLPDLIDAVDRLDLPGLERIVIGGEYEERLAAADPSYPDLTIDPEAGLVILYTSGTTGLPKGALISHRAMVARGMAFASEFGVPVGDHFLSWAPMFHMVSTDKQLATLLRGGTVHVVNGYEPDAIIDFLTEYETHWLPLIPGMVGPFAEALRDRNARVKGVAMCGAMADLVPREDIAAATSALGAPYVNTFGATETGLPPASSSVIPVGVAPTDLRKRQSAFCDLRLVDPDDIDVPVGTPGEVALRGPTLFSGYWNADETNARDFRNGWFHMGDVMRRNLDGTLDYVDRVKYMIKSGGENIYPAEIESVLLKDERLAEVVVVKRRDPTWGEVPVAFVVAREPVDEAELLERCRRDLSSYKRPKAFLFITDDDLPRSTTGKIQRHLLEERLTAP